MKKTIDHSKLYQFYVTDVKIVLDNCKIIINSLASILYVYRIYILRR